MENLFVPHKLSIDLMSIGFKEKTIARYRGEDLYADYISGYYTEWRFEEPFENAILAPTWDQVFEWFREVHNFQHNIEWNKFYIEQKVPYQWEVRPTWKDQLLEPYGYGGFSSSYREAQIACLKKMIEQVKSIINH